MIIVTTNIWKNDSPITSRLYIRVAFVVLTASSFKVVSSNTKQLMTLITVTITRRITTKKYPPVRKSVVSKSVNKFPLKHMANIFPNHCPGTQ